MVTSEISRKGGVSEKGGTGLIWKRGCMTLRTKYARILKFLTWHGFDGFGWNDPMRFLESKTTTGLFFWLNTKNIL